MRRTLLKMATTTPSHATKRPRLTGPLIGTHSGTFHADEALAVYLLRLLPTYASSPLVRTRDPALLADCHTVVDVGGVYDDEKRRYDHHQREFATTFPGRSTKLSSAGLVFMHLGRDVIAAETGLSKDSEDVETLYQKLYTDFIEAFDANDNGISNYDIGALAKAGFAPKFSDRGFSIASVVGRFNHARVPVEAEVDGGDVTNGAAAEGNERTAEMVKREEDARFQTASTFTGEQFLAELHDTAGAWLPARGLVRKAFSNRRSAGVDEKGRILVLREGLPWHDHLFAAEEEEGSVGNVLYVLFPEGDPAGKWRIRAVSKAKEGFELRKPLPEAWRGVRDQDLSGVAGIEGCVFVHASGFIGGNNSYEGALAMAKRALDMD